MKAAKPADGARVVPLDLSIERTGRLLHPARLTADELIREIAGETAELGDSDAIERAVRDLGGVGLLHTRDEFVLPTRAALRFQELLDR